MAILTIPEAEARWAELCDRAAEGEKILVVDTGGRQVRLVPVVEGSGPADG